jgi:septal ring factor EnvC (AmiA/AmiB activator)
VGAGAFFALLRFRAREREAKKERESAKKKSESAERERKKARIRAFLPPTVKIRFQSPKPLGRGKAMVLSKTIQ